MDHNVHNHLICSLSCDAIFQLEKDKFLTPFRDLNAENLQTIESYVVEVCNYLLLRELKLRFLWTLHMLSLSKTTLHSVDEQPKKRKVYKH